ncbi:MAG: T9SS type A sorting domain-containing protein, partial [Bacteroidia bacterium]|nr:T9SS type A sorting domain-containing protein [Bacteroidia bacterium]
TSTQGLLYSVTYANDMVIPVKSTDNGATWSALPGNPDNSEETYSIDVDYNNPNRVIISYYGEIYFSNNGGTSFTSIHTASGGSGNVVGGVFFDGNNIYIGTNDGVLVSTNGGSSFAIASITGLPGSERIWSFAGAKTGTTTRFFCITADVGDIYVGVVGSDYYNFAKGVYAVDYGSGNWTSKLNGINTSVDFPMFVGMAGNCIDTVYLAGSNSNGVPDILKTTNGGTSWTHIFNSTNNQNVFTGWSGQGGDRSWGYGECPFGLAVAPNNVSRVIFGDFGFVHKTSDGGTSWVQAYVNPSGQHNAGSNTPVNQSYQSCGLENTTCWQLHWTSATNMFACFSDIRGIRSIDSGNSWSFNYTGHLANSMYRIVEHPTNGILFAGTSNIHDMYQSTRLQDAILDANDANGKIIYSTNGGQTWQNLKTFNHPVFWIALDPNNPNRAYASVIHYNGGSGIGGVYMTNDLQNLASASWTLLPDPPRTEKHPASIAVLKDGKMVCTYSGRRNSSGVFQASSGVFIYDPSTNNWSDVSHIGMYYWTKDIVIDPNDPTQNTWYVGVFSGWGGAPNGLGGLYKTTNRGTSWTKLTSASTIDRVTSCSFNPNDPDEIYMTTEANGLWISSNINATNPIFSQVTSYPFQQPERVFFNPHNSNEIWVTSFGNGIKMGTVSTGTVTTFLKTFDDGNESEFILFPNPAVDKIKLKIKSGNAEAFGYLKVYNSLGQKIIDSVMKPELNVSVIPEGVYVIEISGEQQTLCKRFVIKR